MTTTVTTVDSGRATLAVETAGTGKPVVFLHAGVADRRMWHAEMIALATTGAHRAVAYDRRGFGDTLHADEDYSHVGDLRAVLDALAPGERAVLVGCSQGGRVALDAALAHPALVRGLVLVAPAIGGAPEVEAFPPALERWFARMEHAEAAADVDAINALEAHAWLDGPLAPDGRVGGAVRDLFLAMNDIALRAEQRGTEIEPPPAWPRLHDVAAPALVVCGDLDFPHIVERCARLAAEMPASEAHTMHGAAHLPNLEQPAQFMHLLRPFLARLPA